MSVLVVITLAIFIQPQCSDDPWIPLDKNNILDNQFNMAAVEDIPRLT